MITLWREAPAALRDMLAVAAALLAVAVVTLGALHGSAHPTPPARLSRSVKDSAGKEDDITLGQGRRAGTFIVHHNIKQEYC